MLAFLAGTLISLSAIAYLSIGGIPGAIFFAIGLLTILHFRAELFTGKAGLLASRAISPKDLFRIWCGNLLGCIFMASVIIFTSPGQSIADPASAIILTRISNLWFENIILGFCCGLFMFIAVSFYDTKPWVTVICVAAFILSSTNHCVADMFYYAISFSKETAVRGFVSIFQTTVGNVIGCNFIPLLLRHRQV